MYQPLAVPGSFTRKLVEGASSDAWIQFPCRIAREEGDNYPGGY